MLNKKGFTLSEVMVAIGVLGVLAALLIPAIMSNTPDNNKVMFKKAYSTIENTVTDLINDDTNYPDVKTFNAATCNDGTADVSCGFHNTTATSNAGANKFCYFFADKLNIIGTANCTNNGDWSFITTDGIRWGIYVPSAFPLSPTDYSTTITVDVNGEKDHNCSSVALTNPVIPVCAAGTSPDTFRLGVRYDGKLQVTDAAAITILENPTNNKKQ